MSQKDEQGTGRRRRYVVAAGAVVSGLTLASGGAAVAAPGGAGHAAAEKQAAVSFVRAAAKPAKADPDQKALNAYFKAGYDWDDALKLAKLWHTSAFNAKVLGGDKLLAGEKLPIKPGAGGGGGDGQTALQAREVNAFFKAGYDYADAVKLAKLWHTTDAYHAKLKGGGKLLHGIALPFPPH